jgi:hypothetical protein
MALRQGLAGPAGVYAWDDAVAAAAWKPAPPKPRARLNSTACQLQQQGFLTVGQLAKAAGVARSTLQWWLASGRLPKLPIVRGVQAIPKDQAVRWLRSCERARLRAARCT